MADSSNTGPALKTELPPCRRVLCTPHASTFKTHHHPRECTHCPSDRAPHIEEQRENHERAKILCGCARACRHTSCFVPWWAAWRLFLAGACCMFRYIYLPIGSNASLGALRHIGGEPVCMAFALAVAAEGSGARRPGCSFACSTDSTDASSSGSSGCSR